MKSWKKQLNDEFDSVAPELDNGVLAAPIITCPEEQTQTQITGNQLIRNKKVLFGASAAGILAILFVLLAVLGVFAKTPASNGFIFTLEINPATAFIVNANGKVEHVTALNEDADILLSDEELLAKLKNISVEEAIVIYTDNAARLGFLDLSQEQNAVRLSVNEQTDDTLLKSTAENLRGYFKQKGIFAAVIEKKATLSEMCNQAKIEEQSDITNLISALKNISVFYEQRIPDDANAEDVKELYDKYITSSQTLDYIRDELLNNIDGILSDYLLLSKIKVCNHNIKWHRDNPKFLADYWRVIEIENQTHTSEFKQLLTEMEELLTEYKTTFGVSIDSYDNLLLCYDVYSSFTDMDFSLLFSQLTLNDLLDSIEKYVGILKNIGANTSVINSLLQAPETVREYCEQLQSNLDALREWKASANSELYNKKREQISDDDYSLFLSNLIQKYGSLDNFWEETKKS